MPMRKITIQIIEEEDTNMNTKTRNKKSQKVSPKKLTKEKQNNFKIKFYHDAEKYNETKNIYIDSSYFDVKMAILILNNYNDFIEINFEFTMYRQDQGGGNSFISDSKINITIPEELNYKILGELGLYLEDNFENEFNKIAKNCYVLNTLRSSVLYELETKIYKRLFGIQNKCDYSWTDSSETEDKFNEKKEFFQSFGLENLNYCLSTINNGAERNHFNQEQLTELRKMYFETLIAWYELFPNEKCKSLTEANDLFEEEEN